MKKKSAKNKNLNKEKLEKKRIKAEQKYIQKIYDLIDYEVIQLLMNCKYDEWLPNIISHLNHKIVSTNIKILSEKDSLLIFTALCLKNAKDYQDQLDMVFGQSKARQEINELVNEITFYKNNIEILEAEYNDSSNKSKFDLFGNKRWLVLHKLINDLKIKLKSKLEIEQAHYELAKNYIKIQPKLQLVLLTKLSDICKKYFDSNDASKSKELATILSSLNISDIIIIDLFLTKLNSFYHKTIYDNSNISDDQKLLLQLSFDNQISLQTMQIKAPESFEGRLLGACRNICDGDFNAFVQNMNNIAQNNDLLSFYAVKTIFDFSIANYKKDLISTQSIVTFLPILDHQIDIIHSKEVKDQLIETKESIDELSYFIGFLTSMSNTHQNNISDTEQDCTTTEEIDYSDEDYVVELIKGLNIDQEDNIIHATDQLDHATSTESEIVDNTESTDNELSEEIFEFKLPSEEHKYYQTLKKQQNDKKQNFIFPIKKSSSWFINDKEYYYYDNSSVFCVDETVNLFATLDRKIKKKLDNSIFQQVMESIQKGVCTKYQYGVKFLANKKLWEIKIPGDLRIFATKEYKSSDGKLLLFDLKGDHNSYKTLKNSEEYKVKSFSELPKNIIENFINCYKNNFLSTDLLDFEQTENDENCDHSNEILAGQLSIL